MYRCTHTHTHTLSISFLSSFLNLFLWKKCFCSLHDIIRTKPGVHRRWQIRQIRHNEAKLARFATENKILSRAERTSLTLQDFMSFYLIGGFVEVTSFELNGTDFFASHDKVGGDN